MHPDMTSWPLGSYMSARRKSSWWAFMYTIFSVIVFPMSSGAPLVTVLVGFPPVCVSMVVTNLENFKCAPPRGYVLFETGQVEAVQSECTSHAQTTFRSSLFQ